MVDLMKERSMDSGMIVVVFIISSLIITVFSFLLFVDYEWCHVLFKNNTENPACTKNDNRDKVLLTSSIGDLKEENKKYRETHHQTSYKGDTSAQSERTNRLISKDNEKKSKKW